MSASDAASEDFDTDDPNSSVQDHPNPLYFLTLLPKFGAAFEDPNFNIIPGLVDAPETLKDKNFFYRCRALGSSLSKKMSCLNLESTRCHIDECDGATARGWSLSCFR